MFEGFRVVVVCPAGRRDMADIMRRYVERERPLVDKFHWWLNTNNRADLDYFRGLVEAAPEFYVGISMPGWNSFHHRHMGIGRFFRNTINHETIYVRIDDDVVWMDEHCIEHLVDHRLKFPDAYLVYGNIVNSSRFMHLHQKAGAFDPGFKIAYEISHPTNRCSPVAALSAHRTFLDDVESIAEGEDAATVLAPWKSFDRWVFAPGEYNDCNMICWFGRDFAAWGGYCPHHIHEEQWICLRMPCVHEGRIHESCGAALCSHYASVIQWPALVANPDILQRYQRLAPVSDIKSVPRRRPHIGPMIKWRQQFPFRTTMR